MTTLASVVVLFVLTKILGYKQLSQLTMFDYVNGITIGSIAAEMATSLENDFTKPLLAMVVYGAVGWLISYGCMKSVKFRRIATGKATVLYNNGKLYEQCFKSAKVEINEFMMLLRNSGYFDLSAVETVILEANGKLSILPKSTDRPLTPADMNLNPEQEFVGALIIEDGNVLEENLKNSGLNRAWLDKELDKQKVKHKEVFLGIYSGNNTLNVYKKTSDNTPKDILE